MNDHPTPHDIKHWSPCIVVQPPVDPMLARAQHNYPGSIFNQAAWLKAVKIVRATARGWKLDHPLTKGQCNV